MSADFPSLQHRTLRLANGVQLALLHDPQATRVALAAGVAAGSFHEPAAWPGLAHCVEHCLFLGSRGRPGAADFADYVHARGGRYNARTLALHTQYFLEMPAAELRAALDALGELLSAPLFVAERVQREVEVLDAEYQARSADPHQQLLAAVAAQLPPGHPLSRFHAGARDTLPAQSAEFLAELRAWHARHYGGANLRLLLSGPQSLDELERCAAAAFAPLPGGPAPTPARWPGLWPAGPGVVELALQQAQTRERISLWWPLGVPRAVQEGLQVLLRQVLAQTARGGLLGELRARGWAQQLAVELQPADADSAVLVLQLDRLAAGAGREREIAALAADWLACFAADRRLLPAAAEWQALCAAQAWREFELAPLERAALWGERWQAQAEGDWQPWPWRHAEPAELAAGLATLSPQRLIVQHARDEVPGSEITPWFPVRWRATRHAALPAVAGAHWQAAPGNPFFDLVAPLAALPAELAEHRRRQGLRPGHAALLLCWCGAETPGSAAAARLAEAALARQWTHVLPAAAQLGCEWLPLSRPGQLRFCLSGPEQLLPRVLALLLVALDQEQGGAWRLAQQQAAAEEGRQMLLRRLLAQPQAQWWPAAEEDAAPPACDAAAFELVQRFIHDARLHSLCLGNVPAGVRAALQDMGRPMAGPPPAPRRTPAGERHCRLALAGDGQALLLRLLAGCGDARREAAWRLLAVLWQGAFYRALRVEQGLGYALFSRFVAGEDGAELQFGVQSPHAPLARLQEAIRDFLVAAAAALPATSAERLRQAQRAVLDQLDDAGARGERLLRSCRAWLGGEPPGWAEQVARAVPQLSLAELQVAAGELLTPATLRCWVSSS